LNKNLKNTYVKLPNEIYDSLDIANDELTILLLLYRNYQQYKNITLCSIQMLIDMMKVNSRNNTKIILQIKEIIISLIDKGYITNIYNLFGCDIYDIYENEKAYNVVDRLRIEEIISNKDTLFYAELVSLPEDNYFMVMDSDINDIFTYLQSLNISKFDFVRYFVACCRVRNNQSNFGYLTQSKMKDIVNDARTISRYNKILQDELHLIRYNNSYLTKSRHYCTTFIGLYDDEQNFNEQLEVEVERQSLVYTDKVISNKKRKVKQKLNNNEKKLLVDKTKELEEENRRLKEQLEALQYKPKEESKDNDEDAMDFIKENYPELLEVDEEDKDDYKLPWEDASSW
jgi:hypothetical protein